MASLQDPELPPIEDEDAGIMGLTEVDPSPVEETPFEYKEKSYFPDQQQGESWGPGADGAKRTGTLGLRLGDHGVVWWCTFLHPNIYPTANPSAPVTRTQRYSSYAFTIFTTFHITNTALIPLLTRSVHAANRSLLLTRPYYQSPIAEPLLVALPLVAHVASGIALRLYRRRQALQRYGAETRGDRRTIPWPALSGTSALGYALVPLAGFHAWTTRILPLYAHGDSSLINLSYISHGFASHPFISFTGFAALVSIGTWHVVWGAAKWLGWAPSQVSANESQKGLVRKRRWYTINGISAVVAGLWLAGGLGVVGRDGKVVGWIGKEYDELYRYIPFLGSA
tara:strand:- start:24102 stop:25118 length:1017 start_codon:yes stop_codon:yes gene_type:complete